MITGIERGVSGKLTRQETAGKRHTHDHTDVSPRGFPEEELRRAPAEHVEDDLHGCDVVILQCLKALFHLLDGHAEIRDLAFFFQYVEQLEDLGPVVNLRRRAVQLHEVQLLQPGIAKAVLHETTHSLGAVASSFMRTQLPATLCCDIHALSARAHYSADGGLAPTPAVYVGRINEVDPGIHGGIEYFLCDVIVELVAPATADLPRAERNLRYIKPCLSQLSIFHGLPPVCNAGAPGVYHRVGAHTTIVSYAGNG